MTVHQVKTYRADPAEKSGAWAITWCAQESWDERSKPSAPIEAAPGELPVDCPECIAAMRKAED